MVFDSDPEIDFILLYAMYLCLCETEHRKKKRRIRTIVNPPQKTQLDCKRLHFSQLKRNKKCFLNVTRMSVDKFDTLLCLLKQSLQRFSYRQPIDLETHLGITLVYLSQGCSLQMLALYYKIELFTLRQIVHNTCAVIWCELQQVYVTRQTQAELKAISNRFLMKTGMPHCVGAVNGKRVNISCPNHDASLRYNSKKTHSVVVMAACDANYAFTYVDVGELESQNDEGTFSRSSFGKMIIRGDIALPPDDSLPGTSEVFPYFFVASSSFPLKENLMHPYPGKQLSAAKKSFNQCLLRAQGYIENTFGILGIKWKILQSPIVIRPKNVNKIVLATVALHNFLMLDSSGGYFTRDLVDHFEKNVFVPGSWKQAPSQLKSIKISMANRSSTAAFSARDRLAKFLVDN